MLKSSPVAWAVRAAKAVLVVRVVLVVLVGLVVLVADDPVADDLAVQMLRAEIRKAIARDDQHRNRSYFRSAQRGL